MKVLISSFLFLALVVGQAGADLMLTTTSGLSFLQNSGTQSFQLFGKSAPTDPAIIALIGTIAIDSPAVGLGNFTNPISYVLNLDASNVNASSTGVLDPIDARIAYLSLDFTAPQLLPTVTPGVLGTFNFDTNGLAPGTYNILLSALASDSPNVVGTNGSFTITAIPEPSSILVTGLGLGAIVFRRRRYAISSFTVASR